jgi:hypothetical protein
MQADRIATTINARKFVARTTGIPVEKPKVGASSETYGLAKGLLKLTEP